MNVKEDSKVHYVTRKLFPMLLNDLRTVIEARCPVHGIREIRGSGPNFTAVLLCMVAVDVLAELFAPKGETKKGERIRHMLSTVGTLAKDPNYERLSGPLFGYFRHGIAHTFLPLAHNGVIGSAVWTTKCPQWLASPEGAETCAQLRRARHLVIRPFPKLAFNAFQVVPQILYIDVRRTVRTLGTQLRLGKLDIALFSANYDRWESINQSLQHSYLNASERAALGMAPATLKAKKGEASR